MVPSRSCMASATQGSSNISFVRGVPALEGDRDEPGDVLLFDAGGPMSKMRTADEVV